MTNIAFLCDWIGTQGGAEHMIISLANDLTRRGNYNVSLIGLLPFDKPFYDIDDKVKVFRLLKMDKDFDKCNSKNILTKTKAYYDIVSKISHIVKKNKVKILVVAGLDSPFFSYFLKIWFPNLKIIYWEHFNHDAEWGNRRMDLGRSMSKKYASAIVTLTSQDKEMYEAGGAKVPVYAVPNFMEYYPQGASPLTSKNVSFIGKIDFRKGWDILVDVWAMVKKNEVSSGWKLNVIGGGAEIENTRKKAEELNVINSVNIVAPTREVEKYYLDSSIYIMTSRREGLPMVLIEAKSYGIPIVSLDCLTGPRDIVRNNIDGFLIPVKDLSATTNRSEEEKKEMADKILLLMADENLRKDMGRKAREDSKKFMKESIIDRWEKLFSEVVNK